MNTIDENASIRRILEGTTDGATDIPWRGVGRTVSAQVDRPGGSD
jgi:hypothetical protein